MKKITILMMLILCIVYTKTIAQSGDLELVSIDPEELLIEVGEKTNLILVVNQNGPGDLPIGSARVTVALDTRYVHWVLPIAISDDCGNVWAVHTNSPTATTTQIQLRNNNAVLANNAGCEIKIPIIGATIGEASIIGGSTVFGTGVSDPNGNNQSASAFITVTEALPVTLTNFIALEESQTVALNWETISETNSDFFEVQRSQNGKDWSKIGSVNSSGESSSFKRYSFVDTTPYNGENLYRLKMVDLDQTFSMSPIRSVRIDTPGNVYTYPNPASDKLFFNNNNIKKVALYNISGIKVLDTDHVPTSGIDIKHIIAGIYITEIRMNDGSLHTTNVVVAK